MVTADTYLNHKAVELAPLTHMPGSWEVGRSFAELVRAACAPAASCIVSLAGMLWVKDALMVSEHRLGVDVGDEKE
jgi:hypothetical protein